MSSSDLQCSMARELPGNLWRVPGKPGLDGKVRVKLEWRGLMMSEVDVIRLHVRWSGDYVFFFMAMEEPAYHGHVHTAVVREV